MTWKREDIKKMNCEFFRVFFTSPAGETVNFSSVTSGVAKTNESAAPPNIYLKYSLTAGGNGALAVFIVLPPIVIVVFLYCFYCLG